MFLSSEISRFINTVPVNPTASNPHSNMLKASISLSTINKGLPPDLTRASVRLL